MIIVRKTSTRTVFSSSWSRRKQAEMLDEWQQIALQVLNTYEIAARRYTALPHQVSCFKGDIKVIPDNLYISSVL